jgi:hypothetical protein
MKGRCKEECKAWEITGVGIKTKKGERISDHKRRAPLGKEIILAEKLLNLLKW